CTSSLSVSTSITSTLDKYFHPSKTCLYLVPSSVSSTYIPPSNPPALTSPVTYPSFSICTCTIATLYLTISSKITSPNITTIISIAIRNLPIFFFFLLFFLGFTVTYFFFPSSPTTFFFFFFLTLLVYLNANNAVKTNTTPPNKPSLFPKAIPIIPNTTKKGRRNFVNTYAFFHSPFVILRLFIPYPLFHS